MDERYLAIAAILLAASWLQSATGFGLALVAMGLAPLVMPVKEAIAFVSLASFGVNAFIMFANRSGLSWRRALPLVVATVLGIPVGYYGLHLLDGPLVIRLLGIVLVLIALTETFRTRFTRLTIPERAGTPLAFIGGVLAGSFNVGGPPVVVYAYARPWSRVEVVAVLQTVFLAASIVRNLLMLQAGEIDAGLLKLVLATLPVALLGVWIGKVTLDRLPETWLRRLAYLLIFAIGLRYAFLA